MLNLELLNRFPRCLKNLEQQQVILIYSLICTRSGFMLCLNPIQKNNKIYVYLIMKVKCCARYFSGFAHIQIFLLL